MLASRRWRVAMIQDAPREFDLRAGRMPSLKNPARYSSRVTRPSPSASYSSTTSSVGASPLPMVAWCYCGGSPFWCGCRRGSLQRGAVLPCVACVACLCCVGPAECARSASYVPESSLRVTQSPSSRARDAPTNLRRRSGARACRRLLYGFFGRMQASGRKTLATLGKASRAWALQHSNRCGEVVPAVALIRARASCATGCETLALGRLAA